MANTIVSNLWLQKRRPYWSRLEALVAAVNCGGVKQLSRAEMQEMALLYRQVASDLSVLRRDGTAQTYATHVNQLLDLDPQIIFSGPKTSFLHPLRHPKD